jgi:hypothetical protein
MNQQRSELSTQRNEALEQLEWKRQEVSELKVNSSFKRKGQKERAQLQTLLDEQTLKR